VISFYQMTIKESDSLIYLHSFYHSLLYVLQFTVYIDEHGVKTTKQFMKYGNLISQCLHKIPKIMLNMFLTLAKETHLYYC